MKQFTPEQKAKHISAIEKIESLPRPAKWKAIRAFTFELHPELKQIDHDFCEAVKELRENNNKTSSSKSGAMRNTMKIPQYIYDAIRNLDADLLTETSGTKNVGYQDQIGEQLYKAFPMYRVARIY